MARRLTPRQIALVYFVIACTIGYIQGDVNVSQLSDLYKDVQNWDVWSPRFDASIYCLVSTPVRFAYVTRLAATVWDWAAIADHLQVPWIRINPASYSNAASMRRFGDAYANDAELANYRWLDMGHLMCRMADVLVFNDVIPDARPLLQNSCSTPIILQVHNRFDYAVRDKPEYDQLIARVAKQPHVWWVYQNPYELKYIQARGIELPSDRTRVLRPVGVALLPPPRPSKSRSKRIAFLGGHAKHHLESSFLASWIHREGLNKTVTFFEAYGGPAVLASFRGVIHIPYQASVMFMYEGLAAGAVFIIPTRDFFAKLLGTFNETMMYFCCRHVLTDYPESWHKYIEWYNPEFRDATVTYGSWKQLAEIIRGSRRYSSTLFAKKRRKGREIMARMRKTTLKGYSDMYEAIRQQACQSAAQPDALSLGLWRMP